ncbi:MAG: biosynthetic arginine decarboxylase [Myxococcota bacterium]
MKAAEKEIRKWTVNDSAEVYQVKGWGQDYFGINKDGCVTVSAPDVDGEIDVMALVQDLERRGYATPLLLRFSDILRHRVATLSGAFANAIAEYGYQGRYRPVFPIKVNQQRQVVEELVRVGEDYDLGLEAGSKPELLVALAMGESNQGLTICNGYKDDKYLEIALYAQKLGRDVYLVVDRWAEIDHIIEVSKRLGIRPKIGIRARLSTRGAGKWVESTGDRSKFGLAAAELVAAVARLKRAGMLDCLQLLHFHIGSQITAIRAIKDALRESSQIYVELARLGANMKMVDVGGGLGVDYDGSQTNFHSSTNYSTQEYANDVVAAIQAACDERDLPHPDIVSESGRALVAHHSLLVFKVLGTDSLSASSPPPKQVESGAHEVVQESLEVFQNITRKNFHEAYHDALELKEQAANLFKLGYLDLEGRGDAERLFWASCRRIQKIVQDLDHIPEDLEGLEKALSDTYYCNFSVFQSAPDLWAVDQLFPIMPIHRHLEQPRRRGILADLTCDSDGKVDEFIDLHDVKSSLELHDFHSDEPYYLGMFMVGAYQEILGDLHNLFGDTNAIQVRVDDSPLGYRIDNVVEGDTVSEVLSYVQYERPELLRRLRHITEESLRSGRIDVKESARLRRRFEDELTGYTYLEWASDEDDERELPIKSIAGR